MTLGLSKVRLSPTVRWKYSIVSYTSSAVEDYRQGYPRFSALVGSHDSFHVCRRFSAPRARLLLLKQDRLSLLEEQLERVDCEETAPFFLGCARRDTNAERKKVLDDMDTALADYGA